MATIRNHEAWRELFAEYEVSHESARDFCARHGLRLTYFYRRSLELRGRSASRRGQDTQPIPSAAAFVPVTVAPRGPQGPIGRMADNITLTIGKASLALSSSVPPAWVAALLTALEV